MTFVIIVLFSSTSSDEPKISTFPRAHVSLTKRQQLLMVGQPYRVLVHIDMPESPQNLDLGMFMVCAEMRDELTNLRDHSCRSAMLHYKSPLVRTITTLVFSPLYVLGLQEEKQLIPVELFTNFEDEQVRLKGIHLILQFKFGYFLLELSGHRCLSGDPIEDYSILRGDITNYSPFYWSSLYHVSLAHTICNSG